jgi:XTP/dITP diphosphohydrolase
MICTFDAVAVIAAGVPRMRLLVATTNAGKLREIRDLLAGLPIELATLESVAPVPAPEETGRTFAENARLKASYYATRIGALVVAEDSGLEIDALDGAPGVHSARFGGEDSSYPEKFRLIEEKLRAVPDRPRTARFVCALALADPTTIRFEASGRVEGEIVATPRGTGGFGYDPIFYYPPFGTTLAEAGSRKSEVSHRARAFAQLRAYLLTA